MDLDKTRVVDLLNRIPVPEPGARGWAGGGRTA